MADKFTERAIQSLRQRHENQVRKDAEHLQTYAGYLLNALGDGRSTSVSLIATGIAADAQEIVSRLAALDALEEAVGIYASAESEG